MKFTLEIDANFFDTPKKVGEVLSDLGESLMRFGDRPISDRCSDGTYFSTQLRNSHDQNIVARAAVEDGDIDPQAARGYTHHSPLGTGGAQVFKKAEPA